jgi:hypothetical protein
LQREYVRKIFVELVCPDLGRICYTDESDGYSDSISRLLYAAIQHGIYFLLASGGSGILPAVFVLSYRRHRSDFEAFQSTQPGYQSIGHPHFQRFIAITFDQGLKR